MAEPIRVLVAGAAQGPVVALDEPLSFWGGFDADTGRVLDPHHPQVGEDLAGAIVTMAVGRGSSSASSVLAEAIRRGTAPAAVVMRQADEIVVLGAVVADEMYDRTMPVVITGPATFERVARAAYAVVGVDGSITTR